MHWDLDPFGRCVGERGEVVLRGWASDDELWSMDLRVMWSSWVTVRPITTVRFLELDDPDRYVGPAVQMGPPCYDGPDGTTDLERGSP